MFAKTFRGSVFISLMIIVSMTLTGCSIDIGSIVSGLQNVIGDIGGKLGPLLEKGMGFAKDFVGKAKEFVGPLLDKGKEMFKEFSPTIDKIKDGFGKAKGIFDKAGDVVKKIKGFSEDMAKKGVDAVGDSLNPAKAIAEIVLDPDNEDAETTETPAAVTTAPATSVTDTTTDDEDAAAEVVSDAELKFQAEEVVKGVNNISNGVSELAEQISKLEITDAEKDALMTKIRSVKAAMETIKKGPTSKEAKSLFEKSRGDVEDIIKEAKKYGDIAKGTLDSLKSVTDNAKETYNKFSDACDSIKSFFK